VSRFTYVLALVVVATGVLFAGIAYAGGGTSVDAYGGTQGRTQGAIHQASVGKAGGTLPFTGQNLGVVAGFGLVLVGTGIALRRRSKSES